MFLICIKVKEITNINYIIEFSFFTKHCTYVWENVNVNTEKHCHFIYFIAILHITFQNELCYPCASIAWRARHG